MDPATKTNIRARLRRIEGQTKGIARMVEEDRYCIDVLLQLQAAQSAMTQVARIVFESHMHSCVRAALESDDADEAHEKVDEVLDMFARYSQLLR